MSLSDRLSLPSEQANDLLHRVILEEINNLKHLNEIMDRDALKRFAEHLAGPNAVYVVGSRLSNTFAYYLGWSLTKIRRGVRVLKKSDSTSNVGDLIRHHDLCISMSKKEVIPNLEASRWIRQPEAYPEVVFQSIPS